MDNWLNTIAGRDFSMRTIPELTKALNRLSDALEGREDCACCTGSGGHNGNCDECIEGPGRLTTNPTVAALGKSLARGMFPSGMAKTAESDGEGLNKIISKVEAKRDWEEDAKLLYTTLSRIYGADNEEMDAAREMAFSVMSDVSVDFRNEYASCKWFDPDEDIDARHHKKKWYVTATYAVGKENDGGRGSEEIWYPNGKAIDIWDDTEGESEIYIERLRTPDVTSELQLLDRLERLRQLRHDRFDEQSSVLRNRDELIPEAHSFAEVLSWQLANWGDDEARARAIADGSFELTLHHEGVDGWEALLKMEVGDFFWTHEPSGGGYNLWYRVE